MITISLLKGIDKRVIRFKRLNPGQTMLWDTEGFEALKVMAQANGLPIGVDGLPIRDIGDSFPYMGVEHSLK